MKQYFKTHEWIEDKGNGKYHMGISQYACDQLGDIVFVEPKEEEIESGESLAILESVKAVGDLYAPFDAKVTAANEEICESPESINGETWIVEIESNGGDIDLSSLGTMDQASYESSLASAAS